MLVGEIAYKNGWLPAAPPSYSTKQSTGFDHCSTEANTIYCIFLICECQKIVLMDIRLIGPFSPNNLFNQSFIDDSTNRPIILSIGPFPQDFFQSFRS